MTEKKHYEYFAFICNTPQDEKFAKWLYKNMETFCIPTCVHETSNRSLSNKIGHLFLSKKDANARKIAEAIPTELFVSKYLLVICTPASAQSPKVNEEIRIFLANNRKDDIILMMLDGEPSDSDPQEECLPVDIRELPVDERPVIMDFKTVEHEKALFSLIAYLKQVPEASLTRRKSKAFRRTTLYLFVSILVLTLASLWEYNRVRYEYYFSFAERWGIPEGIDPLLPEQIMACSHSYKFEYRHTPIFEGNPIKWRLVCVSCTNGYGQLQKIMNDVSFEKEYSVCKLEYLQDDIYSIRYYDADNQLISTCYLQDYEGQPKGWIDRRFYHGASGNMMENRSTDISNKLQISYLKVDRDDDGYIQRISYYASKDSAICDETFAFGYDFYYDKDHRLEKKVSLSKYMKPIVNRQGYMYTSCVYDETSCGVAGVFYYDQQNNPSNYLLYLRSKYDGNGNLIEISYNDPKGEPYLDDLLGISIQQNVWDERGAIKECSYLDESINPMNSKQGYARVCYARDSHGNELSRHFYDEKGNLTLINDGYAIDKKAYSEDNKVIEWSFYGVDEQPILNHDGYACVKYSYDAHNRKQSESYFDEDGMPIVADKEHGARVEYVYNDDGFLVSKSCYDVNGQPYLGLHGTKVVYKYDDRGNRIEKTFYDEHGHLFVDVDKVSIYRYWYDNRGLQIEARCYGADGEPTMNRHNFAIFRCGYDSLNRATYYAFFDKEEKPSIYHFRQCALVKQIYDKNQPELTTAIKYVWKDDDYVEVSRTQVLRDANGNAIFSKTLDSQGRCCLNENGFASWTIQYDQRGNRIACCYCDTEGKPIIVKGYNFASWKASYDHKDRRIEQSYYDIHGNLTVNERGVARWKATYKDDGNVPYMSYYDLAGNIISNEEE